MIELPACRQGQFVHPVNTMKFGCLFVILGISLLILVPSLTLGAKPRGPLWTDPAKAEKEDPDFAIQGEYVGKASGVQVAALGEGKFYLSKFKGGLPGAGWDGSGPSVKLVDKEGVGLATKGSQRIHRTSPTLGKKPPQGADILVGENADPGLLKGKVESGILFPPAQTAREYGDFNMHLEFQLPYKPKSPLSSQDRGNSGVYLHNRYEVQVLDSFGLVYDPAFVRVKIRSDPKQWCGCFYRFKTADTPMCLPPLAWQTYDIEFKAARFNTNGTKTADAVITVVQNGVKIHDAVKLPKGTGVGGTRPEVAEGPIIFQGHGNPVAFRNIWIVRK